ncbi:MAG: ABC transporter ATP-binding protein, partial [Ruminococcaceae bacterium]|nr:ABC transporter ATP-binding protein [Oscillospiraceae bacterium]
MNKKKGRFRTLLGYTRGYRLPLIGAFAILICELLLSFANPLVLSVTIDSVLDSNPLNVPAYFAAIINALGGIEVIRSNLWIMSLLMIAMQLIS